ncbi:hypothetical protein [Flammeovirga sp. OC4]|uniref:hypothetical protein n=1 Tax=Flammeovirga sp. OC4 TaxID=1382345 RepID=UPI0005C7036E|nr:hypothetical protein [Flammeovirga sp. OC4]
MKRQDRLKETASKYFEDHAKAKVLYVFEDGMSFGGHAKAHKDEYAQRTQCPYETFKRETLFPEGNVKNENETLDSKS